MNRLRIEPIDAIRSKVFINDDEICATRVDIKLRPRELPSATIGLNVEDLELDFPDADLNMYVKIGGKQYKLVEDDYESNRVSKD